MLIVGRTALDIFIILGVVNLITTSRPPISIRCWCCRTLRGKGWAFTLGQHGISLTAINDKEGALIWPLPYFFPDLSITSVLQIWFVPQKTLAQESAGESLFTGSLYRKFVEFLLNGSLFIWNPISSGSLAIVCCRCTAFMFLRNKALNAHAWDVISTNACAFRYALLIVLCFRKLPCCSSHSWLVEELLWEILSVTLVFLPKICSQIIILKANLIKIY